MNLRIVRRGGQHIRTFKRAGKSVGKGHTGNPSLVENKYKAMQLIYMIIGNCIMCTQLRKNMKTDCPVIMLLIIQNSSQIGKLISTMGCYHAGCLVAY